MAKKWSELTPDEALAHRRRIERAIAVGDQAEYDLAERQAAGWGDSPRPLSQENIVGHNNHPAPEDLHPVQRPASAPRDWHAEARWVRGICNGQLEQLVEGVGIAIGEIRDELRKEFEGKLILARRDLVEEVRREFSQKIDDMRSQFRTALAGDEHVLERRLKRIDELIDRWSRIELATRPVTIDVRPN
jgi:hypothetical protein